MLTSAKYIHAKFWQTLAWLVIGLAVFVTGLRMLLPVIDLDPYRREIERVAEETAGVALNIAAMQAQLKGVHLALKFTDVSVLDEQSTEPLLFAPEVFVDIQLLKSLFSGQLKLGRARVIGTKLKLERFSDGSVALQGLGGGSDGGLGSTVGGSEGNPGAVAAILLGQNHLRLFDTEIHLKSAIHDRPPLRLSGVTVDLLNDGLSHQLSMSSRIGQEGKEAIRLIANLHQSDEASLAMSGEFYLKSEDLVLGGRLAEWLPAGYRVDKGTLQVELWGDLKLGELQHLQGFSKLDDLSITGPGQAAPFILEQLSGRLDWRSQEGGWLLDLERLVVQQAYGRWPTEQLNVAWQATPTDEKRFLLQADALSLKEINDFLSILQLPAPDLHAALNGLSPQGLFTQLDFTLRQPEMGEIEWQLSGEVDGYSNQPWENVPGVRGLKLAFDGDQAGGWLKIDSSDLMVDFPQLFRRPLQASRASGDFLWNFDLKSGLHLQSDHMQMSTRDVQTLSRIDLQIPISGKDLFVDIQSDFWEADGSRKSDYLPVGIMPDQLVSWLDKSVVGGYVNSGSFLLYGPISKFPFHQQQGRFEVWFGVEDLMLDYMPEWPQLVDGVAEVHFINNGLQVKLREGMLLNSHLQDVAIEIEQLKGTSPVKIQGAATGPFQDLMAILGDTPLRADFHPFVDAVKVEGQTRTSVDLAIPLKKRDRFKIDGVISFDKAALTIKQADLKVDHLTGRLQFNQSAVKAKGLKARLLGDSIVFNVAPYKHDGNQWTRLTTHMPLNLERLQQQFPDWRLEHFSGIGEGDVEVKIAHHPSRVPVRLSLMSDLRGVSIHMPEPLGKSSAEERKLYLGTDFRSDQTTESSIRYADQTHALFRFYDAEEKPWIAAIGFDQESLSLDGIEGFHLSGHLKALNADSWIAWVGSQAAAGKDGSPVIEMDLLVDQLTVLGTACPGSRFTYKNYADGYRVNLTSETAQGMIQVPGDLSHRPILGRFDFIKLNLKELAGAITGQEAKDKKAPDLDPRGMPALNLSVEKLYINDNPMGKGNITWSKEADGITVDSLTLAGDSLDLSGQGYWRLTTKGHSTSLNLKLHTDSLGELQHTLGLTGGIEGAPTDVKAELYWPSSPLEMGAEKLFGSIGLNVGKGQVNNVDPGVGRLIGLFSLNALGKRLALDFSDLFSKGLAFDTIEGNFTLNDGDAYTSDLVMKSTAAVIDVRGRTGLASRTYDQKVVVTPNVSATLPLVGALAIDPTAGVALAITQKLFGKLFDRIAMRTYEVSGSWDDPQFNQPERTEEEVRGETLMPEMPGD
ncbi:MAG: TIGR02099 family protein [Candidatus Thiodiazotropha sp. (ex Rostrolucina anterorostrata)]|nr:TIGR02099 family protein [Candidatus Thiodiazotropha sp. (ex Rostrolucina anterorostrata)]